MGAGRRWRGGNGHCITLASISSGLSGSPMGGGIRRMALVVRLVATPGRVNRERRRVSENRWLPTKKCVLDEDTSWMLLSYITLLCRWRGVWIELDRFGCSVSDFEGTLIVSG
jgi:hypothetical protein